MLQQLTIRNLALIEDMSVEVGPGFNVLSGETGAGKSMIIDALNLVLGERADKDLVRTGCPRARVEGVFTGLSSVREVLEENGIDTAEDLLIVLREIGADGKSVCRMNGTAVTLAFLKKIADRLADIHGQHEHQLLLNVSSHLDFLDSFGGEKIKAQKETVRLAYTYYKSCIDRLNGGFGSEEERARRIEMLEYQITEIEQAQLQPGEEEEIRQKLDFLKNADKIRETLGQAAALTGEGALDDVRTASSHLSKIADASEELARLSERLDSAYYELEDIAQELQNAAENVEADPYELERLEERLSCLKKLYRKYGENEDAVMKYMDDAAEELDKLVSAQQTIEELEKQAEQFRAEYEKQSDKLSEYRHDAAIEFEDRIKEELSELGMKNANLEVDFAEDKVFTPEGTDAVEFLFSANAGEPVRPLSKIISGGEMSRFMLAMKSVAADDAMLPTMVFDEIDTGISGAGANVVAQKIACLSKNHQVIAITHLPQLASMADQHFLIRKHAENGRTFSELTELAGSARVREIARLCGGSETELALERAGEILREAEEFKRSL